MRMESKRSIIWLLIIMILIYIQQSMITYAQEEVTMYKLEISENTGKNSCILHNYFTFRFSSILRVTPALNV